MKQANDWRAEAEARRAAIAATLESLKLTVEARFVPFSQSRNKAEKHKTLNWFVTVKRDGRNPWSLDSVKAASETLTGDKFGFSSTLIKES